MTKLCDQLFQFESKPFQNLNQQTLEAGLDHFVGSLREQQEGELRVSSSSEIQSEMSVSVGNEEEHEGNDSALQSLEMDKLGVEEKIGIHNEELKTLIEEPLKLELKKLSEHLEYAFLAENSKLLVIILAHLSVEQKKRLVEVLKEHQGIIALKAEVIKLLDTRVIYPTSDSTWVSAVQVVPTKGEMIVITNGRNEWIPMLIVTSWRVCIDQRWLNDATRKDYFSLLFIDQMLERLP